MADNKAVYFYSLEGHTKRVAEIIAKKAEADLIEIKPVKDVSAKGFSKFFWGGRQVLMKKKPELMDIKNLPENYDVLYIGTPVWASNFVPSLRTFFDTYKIENKKIVLFCTHEGGLGKCLNKMAFELPGNKIITKKDFLNVNKISDEELEKEIDIIIGKL